MNMACSRKKRTEKSRSRFGFVWIIRWGCEAELIRHEKSIYPECLGSDRKLGDMGGIKKLLNKLLNVRQIFKGVKSISLAT